MKKNDILERATKKISMAILEQSLGSGEGLWHGLLWRNSFTDGRASTVVGTHLDCSKHGSRHVPTSLAEKEGAEQNVLRMEIEGYRNHRAQLLQVTERSEWKPVGSLGIGK